MCERCTSLILQTAKKDLPQEIVDNYRSKIAEFVSRGIKSLGIAHRHNEKWDILGLIPFRDPPRENSAHVINEARDLSLSIEMLSDDSASIARETA